ncbi:hypothetical protein NEISICOT_02791 [Neisseria sicca ATCC 29256]|uniref:Uncharacterized protein n=1 Tax=Neisseria sicca ATCC 29256 TaxID=547045 RepID=C6M8C2_NEISI|nr:hypothetical protein NEISICOT_02791 [Neisseria sicca ATCC 29256]
MLKHQVNRFRTICTVCGFVALSLFKVNPLYNSGVSGWIVFPDTEKQLAFSLVKRLLGKKECGRFDCKDVNDIG